MKRMAIAATANLSLIELLAAPGARRPLKIGDDGVLNWVEFAKVAARRDHVQQQLIAVAPWNDAPTGLMPGAIAFVVDLTGQIERIGHRWIFVRGGKAGPTPVAAHGEGLVGMLLCGKTSGDTLEPLSDLDQVAKGIRNWLDDRRDCALQKSIDASIEHRPAALIALDNFFD
ncbi:MAG: hypothetical protein AAFR55_00130 [Pseudomonadota bacterium]